MTPNINLPTMEDDHLKSGLSGFLKAFDGQGISTGPQRYMFTERLLTGDAKTTFNRAPLSIGMCTVDNFNKVPAEMTKHAFLTCTFCKQLR